MSPAHFTRDGESWVTVEAVAECYHVDAGLICSACEAGYLVNTVDAAGALAVAVRELDRVAVLVRLHVYQGVSLDAVGLFLEVRPG